VLTSSGDTVFNACDRRIVTDDFNAGSDPSMTHGILALSPITNSRSGSDIIITGFALTLAPGVTKSPLHFAAQSAGQSVAITKANQLSSHYRCGPLPDNRIHLAQGESPVARQFSLSHCNWRLPPRPANRLDVQSAGSFQIQLSRLAQKTDQPAGGRTP
jgi:hypothetical protein